MNVVHMLGGTKLTLGSERAFYRVTPPLQMNLTPSVAACQFGKAHQRSHKSDTGHIAKDHSTPGDGVSLDGMEAGSPGCPVTMHGLPTKQRYKYATFWMDHYLQFVYVTMHKTKKAEELLRSKAEFEEFAVHFGVSIKRIRANNGAYTAKIIQDSCSKKCQQLTFCAIGAHWQNGIAERFIGSIIQCARTILLHAMSKWLQSSRRTCGPLLNKDGQHLTNQRNKRKVNHD